MIKIVLFNISIKIKQKYLLEKLYFLKKSFHFTELCTSLIFLASNDNNKDQYLYPLFKNNTEGGRISLYDVLVTTQSL